MIGVALDSTSESWVPTRGATSVHSMPAFFGNPILLQFFCGFNDHLKHWMRSGPLPQPVGIPIPPLFLILITAYRTGVVISHKLSSNLPYHDIASMLSLQ